MTNPIMTTLDAYLDGRKQLIAVREVLFSAVRMYLRPGQRPDANLLGDPLWNSPARIIAEDEWVANATRGYLSILENADKGRSFRLCVLLQGNELRVGIRLPAWHNDKESSAVERLSTTFGTQKPIVTELMTDELMLDWHFNAEQLYTQAQAMEDAVFRIGAAFETALQALTPTSKTIQ